jgi:mannose-6-phosphate isomerase-like protein (cupin superfamily)/rubrerythrin
MKKMDYVPTPYPYPYYANTPTYNSNLIRYQQEYSQEVSKAILDGIKGEASAIDFYIRLANLATDQKEKNDLFAILENEKLHLQQFNNLYIMFTGQQPRYEVERIPFQTYEEGLTKAYEAELADYQQYQNSYLLTQNSPIRDVFLRTSTDEMEHAKRLGLLQTFKDRAKIKLKDYGPKPYVININEASKENRTYRTALWTGNHLQVTLMSIIVGGDIGLEIHPTDDQFLRIEQGQGIVKMGKRKDKLDFVKKVSDDFAIMVPAGIWHNVINTGNVPLKLYSIYAPPHHPHGTVHVTKADATASE